MRTISVCIGSACHLKGSYNVINGLQKRIKDNGLDDKIQVKASFCLGECTKAVSVKIDDGPIYSADENKLDEFFDKYIVRGI
ncbi:(2Fe-2S) ferredoxin domain-containing protein [Dethiothermospora halolimnae]|uniref:(2Fe-2S) ferredoxin domain-containing protein n=1 Tax=Dethiothermospora halolimnae TaxID=3114390 RepID=UPI003CCBD618